MANTKTAGQENGGKPESRFSKGQILGSATFANRRDILAVLLEDGKKYTVAEVNKAMDVWMKKGVK